MKNELLIEKYKRHFAEIQFIRDSIFKVLTFTFVAWGAIFGYAIVNVEFLRDQARFVTEFTMILHAIFLYCFFFVCRSLVVESIHWKIIRKFEQNINKMLKYRHYEKGKRVVKNNTLILVITMVSPLAWLTMTRLLLNQEIDLKHGLLVLFTVVAIALSLIVMAKTRQK